MFVETFEFLPLGQPFGGHFCLIGARSPSADFMPLAEIATIGRRCWRMMKRPTRVGRMAAPVRTPTDPRHCMIIAAPGSFPAPRGYPQMNVQDRSNTFDLNK